MADPPTEVSYSNLPTVSLADKLRLAASKGQLDKVEELLQARAPFDTDRDRRTALHYAALNGYPDICSCLISYGCDINKPDAIGFTALHRACSQGHTEACKTLLEKGCTRDLQDEHGNTALHEASWNGYSKTLDILVKNNCNVSIQNKSGFSPLHLAAQNGHNESSRILIYSGCNTDIKNNYGDTSLHTAARYGHAGVTRILISARCSLNDENKNGDTGLHIAAALKRRKIAKLLVEAGIDCSLRNKQNETASDVARRKEYPEIILIISANCKSKARPHQIVPEDKHAVHIAVDGPNMMFRGSAPTAANKEPEKPEKERRFFFFKRKKKDKDKGPEPSQPTITKPTPLQQQHQEKLHMSHPVNKNNPVQGFFNKYVPKEGSQYYRDLAGNIKEGPIGYTPICQCMPIVKRIEKNMDETKENLYDHIDASHQILQNRINQLDKRTSQQVFSIDRLNKERLDASHNECKQRVDTKINQQRKDVEQLYSKYNENVKSELQAWLDTRLTDEESCHPHHHDDSGFYHRSVFFDVVNNENGRLFRSRSDETLSQSDYSVRHRKKDFYENRQAAMQQIRAWQTPDRYRRRDNYPVRDSPLRQLPNVTFRNTVSIQPGPSITRPHTMIECTSPNRTSPFVSPTSAIAHLSLESPQNLKTFDNRTVRPFTPSTLRQPTFPSKTHAPNLPSSSSQSFAPGHSGPPVKHQSQVMSHLNHSSLRQNDERQNLVERGSAEVIKSTGAELGPNNVFTSNQSTLRQFNKSSMEKDSKETVRNQRQLLTVSSYSVTKTSETQLLQTKQSPTKSPAAKLNRTGTINNNDIYSGMRPRSHSQNLITDSPVRDIVHEKKCIGYYHSEQTMPLDRSKSYNNLKDELPGSQPNTVTLQSNTATMSQYTRHQSYTVPTTLNTAPPPNFTHANNNNNNSNSTAYTPRPSMTDSAGKSCVNETMQSLQKDVLYSNSRQSVCREQYQKQMQKVLSQTALDPTSSPYKNPAQEPTSPYKNPPSSYKNPAPSYHSSSKNIQMSNPNPNDFANTLSRSEPQLIKADSPADHHYRNNPTTVLPSVVTAPNNNNTNNNNNNNSSAVAHIQHSNHQSHWPSTPLQKSNPKLSSPMLDWCHKEDSSSNPDSGYSCRIYGNRGATMLNTSHSNTTTPTSSFSGTDHSPSAASLQVSPYRGTPQQQQQQRQVAKDSYDERQPSNKQYFETVTAHLQSWYNRKKLETSQKEVPKTLSTQQQQLVPPFAGTNTYMATNCPLTPMKSYIRGSDV